MARRAGNSVRSRRLAYELRKLRIGAGLSCAELGKAMDMSSSKISRVEIGDSGIYLDDVEKLLDYFEVGRDRRAFLLELARNAEQRGWLRVHGTNLPDDWQTWIDFEAEASGLLSYQPLTVPGQLQTAEYARAIIQATGGKLSDDHMDALVASRMARQTLLTRTRPLHLQAIIEEDVLRRPIGNSEAMGRQLRHLADSAARPNVTVFVLQSQTGLHPGLNGPFVVLDYDDESSLVLLENKVSSLFLDEPEHIDTYSDTWTELIEAALTDDDSIALIRKIAEEFSA